MQALTIYHVWVSRLIAALSGLIGVAVFLYGALLFGAMAHASHATSARAEIRSLTSQVAELESRYLLETKAISPERAVALGFVAPVAVSEVYAEGSTLTLAGAPVIVR